MGRGRRCLAACYGGGDRMKKMEDVVRFYEYFGLHASAEDPRPPDHLSTELEFMKFLAYKEAASASPRLQASFRRAQLDFSERELGRWLPELSVAVEANKPHAVLEVGSDDRATLSSGRRRHLHAPALTGTTRDRTPMKRPTATASLDCDTGKRWSWETCDLRDALPELPGDLPLPGVLRDGQVLFEEPAAVFDQVEDGVPDMNPMSCQKGSAWSVQLDAPDRLLHPLRRVGERGSGEWEGSPGTRRSQRSADAIVEAIDLEGPESIVFEETVEGGLLTQAPYLRFAGIIGAVTLDANGLINDFPAGHHITFGQVFLREQSSTTRSTRSSC